MLLIIRLTPVRQACFTASWSAQVNDNDKSLGYARTAPQSDAKYFAHHSESDRLAHYKHFFDGLERQLHLRFRAQDKLETANPATATIKMVTSLMTGFRLPMFSP